MNMDDKENAQNISTHNSSNDGRHRQEFDGKESSAYVKNMDPEPESLTTKVYYFVDDQIMPYSTEVPVPPSNITLNDFKNFITRRNYKYYCKVMDTALNAEVKAEIRDEYDVLKPNINGRFEIFLLSENMHQDFLSAPPILPPPVHHYQATQNRVARASKRASAHYVTESKMPFLEQDTEREDNHLFAGSNFASSLSDGDSQYTVTDFTSVSQQNPHHHNQHGRFGMGGGGGQHHMNMLSSNRRYDGNNKPYWTREKRKRYRRSPPPSFLSSTFEDTEVSMALDLITVTFNMDTRRPFGMSVVVKKNRAFYGIVVHEVAPNSLVALDGRIKPGYILLEINGIPLDEYETPEEAITVLSNAVRDAIETRGQLKLTCARGETPRPMHTFFRPPITDPVRPIDPTAWVQHTNAARGLNVEVCSGFQCSAAYFMNMPKSATIPKTNLQMKTHNPSACHRTTSPTKPSVRAGLRMIQNPSTEITTTSGHSSMECSVGQEGLTVGSEQQKSGGGRGHGIGLALRRLVCIFTTDNRATSGRKRKASKRSGKK